MSEQFEAAFTEALIAACLKEKGATETERTYEVDDDGQLIIKVMAAKPLEAARVVFVARTIKSKQNE